MYTGFGSSSFGALGRASTALHSFALPCSALLAALLAAALLRKAFNCTATPCGPADTRRTSYWLQLMAPRKLQARGCSIGIEGMQAKPRLEGFRGIRRDPRCTRATGCDGVGVCWAQTTSQRGFCRTWVHRLRNRCRTTAVKSQGCSLCSRRPCILGATTARVARDEVWGRSFLTPAPSRKMTPNAYSNMRNVSQ